MQLSILPYFFYLLINFSNQFLSIELYNLDNALGSALGVSSAIGGLILVLIIFISASSLGVWKKNVQYVFIVGLLVMLIGIALTWLSFFVLIIFVFAIALGIADKLGGVLGGKLWH